MSRYLVPALFITIAGCLLAAMAAAPAAAQQASADQDIGALPLSLVIDNAISAHEQDIKDRMLDYEFDHATSEAAKADIVKEHSDELAASAMKKQAFLKALDNNSAKGLISDSRLKAMLNATFIDIERMANSSMKLQEKAQKLSKHADMDPVEPAVADLNSARSMADHVSKAHDNQVKADNVVHGNQNPGQK